MCTVTGAMSRQHDRNNVGAQRLRSLLTCALPHLAAQARIELTHAHVAIGDLAGARTLTGEIDELLTRRPGLGPLVHEAAGRVNPRRPIRAIPPHIAEPVRPLVLMANHLTFGMLGTSTGGKGAVRAWG